MIARADLFWFIGILLYAFCCGSCDGVIKEEVNRPVLLVPGFASSQLHAWQQQTCDQGSFQKNFYPNVRIGDRMWVDVGRILAQSDCWIRCMKLHIANQSEVECKLRAADGYPAIAELDPGLVTGPLSKVWRSIIEDLVHHFGYDPHQILVAPYDWRLPPSKLQQRDHYFYSLMRRIEEAVYLHGHNGGLVVIAHSMGNNIVRYFLAWLKFELGKNHWQEWIDKHISAFFSVGAPLLGGPEGLEVLLSGLTQGLPLGLKELRTLEVTFGSLVGILPIPSGLNEALDKETILTISYKHSKENQTAEKNYSSADVSSGKLFRDLANHDPAFEELEKMRQNFYVADDVLDYTKPWERPPIATVYSVYGINSRTKYRYKYDTDTSGIWQQTRLETEQQNERFCRKTGDTTIPYNSLSWSHTWLGDTGTLVDITRTPQSVYFSTTSVKKVKAMRRGEKHHADYVHSKGPLCERSKGEGSDASGGFLDGLFGKSNEDQVTFFESAFMKNGKKYATGVWEIDGAGHREILSNPIFLRELRAELRHVFKGEIFSSDKSSRPPIQDSDCYWNYREAKCEFPDHCEYRYKFGDVMLDQSCRLKRTHQKVIIDIKDDENGQCYISEHESCVAPCEYCHHAIHHKQDHDFNQKQSIQMSSNID